MPCGQIDPSWEQGRRREGGQGIREVGGLEQGEGQADQEGRGGGAEEHGSRQYGVYGRGERGGGTTGKTLRQLPKL